jgi:rhamnose utilization protein RhaD (predicted bifunctional aldolase and dehydrogenase)
MRKRALSGSFYPDHVIFLGPAARTGTEDGSFARLTLLEGQGAFLPADAGPSADELALCLALVLERVPQEAALVRLTPGAEAALLDWDAEKYRQALQRAL